jgi:peptidoglycan/xylan/chitin deacetylase (PgdA/CDA1 family)
MTSIACRTLLPVAVAVVAVAVLAPAAAADLKITATHDREPLLKTTGSNTTVYAGKLTLTVANRGDPATDGSEVTVTDTLPPGLSALVNNPGFDAGPVAASGDGWTCSGTSTSTCTRSDALAAGAKYPPITITVRVANNASAQVTNNASVSNGGRSSSTTDDITVADDACPNGWSPETEVTFAPPSGPGLHGGIHSGVTNTERADGCTLLDQIWAGEPFRDHGSFVSRVDAVTGEFTADGLLTSAERHRIQSAAARSDVGQKTDHQLPNSCPNRLAISFDDGPSFYRPQTLQNFRDKQVHATFFDVGVRALANPKLVQFETHEGHVLLNHTYDHPHLNALVSASPALVRDEILKGEAAFDAIGVPLTFAGLRPPFFEANAAVLSVLTELGYTSFTSRIETTDYEPNNTVTQTTNAIVDQLRPGAIILLHDGPIDTPAGQASTDAAPMIIDAARAQGYCFGVLDDKGNVVADRAVSSGDPIPQIRSAVPYLPLVRAGTPPEPFTFVPQPLRISATHSPGQFARGQAGNTLTLTVTNVSDDPTDGSTITVRDQIPSGLSATAASGSGWTCTGTGTRTCTRTDVLAPHASYPPVDFTVSVAANAPPTITNAATVTGHGGNVWVDSTSDQIEVTP